MFLSAKRTILLPFMILITVSLLMSQDRSSPQTVTRAQVVQALRELEDAKAGYTGSTTETERETAGKILQNAFVRYRKLLTIYQDSALQNIDVTAQAAAQSEPGGASAAGPPPVRYGDGGSPGSPPSGAADGWQNESRFITLYREAEESEEGYLVDRYIKEFRIHDNWVHEGYVYVWFSLDHYDQTVRIDGTLVDYTPKIHVFYRGAEAEYTFAGPTLTAGRRQTESEDEQGRKGYRYTGFIKLPFWEEYPFPEDRENEYLLTVRRWKDGKPELLMDVRELDLGYSEYSRRSERYDEDAGALSRLIEYRETVIRDDERNVVHDFLEEHKEAAEEFAIDFSLQRSYFLGGYYFADYTMTYREYAFQDENGNDRWIKRPAVVLFRGDDHVAGEMNFHTVLNAEQKLLEEKKEQLEGGSERIVRVYKREGTIADRNAVGGNTQYTLGLMMWSTLDRMNPAGPQLIAYRQTGGGNVLSGGTEGAFDGNDERKNLLELKVPEILPQPGTDSYKELEKRLIEAYREAGIKIDKLLAFRDKLSRRIRNLESPEGLPGYFETLGFSLDSVGLGWITAENEQRQAEVTEWRLRVLKSAHIWWMKMLSGGSIEAITAGLQRQAAALAKFDQALQLDAEAVLKQIEANQTYTEQVISGIPLIGDAIDIYGAIRGESMSGRKLSGLEQVLTGVFNLGPIGIAGILKVPAAKRFLVNLKDALGSLTGPARRQLAKRLGMAGTKLDGAYAALKTKLYRQVSRQMDNLKNKVDDVYKKIKPLPEIKQSRTVLTQAKQESRESLFNLKKMFDRIDTADPDAVRKAMNELQSNKLSQGLINQSDEFVELRKKASGYMEGVYNQADKKVLRELNSEDYLTKIKKRYPDAEGVEVKVMGVTNQKAVPKFGRDRDVTYYFEIKQKDGTILKVDVDHNLSEPIYQREFFEASTGIKWKEVGDTDVFAEWADELDQAVTSKYHVEAYNVGDARLQDFMSKNKTPTITRLEDYKDTVVYKSEHWWHKAKEAEDLKKKADFAAEGMRQAKKQYDKIITGRLKQYGKRVEDMVPAHIQKSMDIFEKVEKMELTPLEAEKMLEALTPAGRSLSLTKEGVVKEMGEFLVKIEKTMGDEYRKLHTGVLKDFISKNADDLAPANAVKHGIERINSYLSSGKISGADFLKLRTDLLNKALTRLDNASGGLEALKNWTVDAFNRGFVSRPEKIRIMNKIEKIRG